MPVGVLSGPARERESVWEPGLAREPNRPAQVPVPALAVGMPVEELVPDREPAHYYPRKQGSVQR